MLSLSEVSIGQKSEGVPSAGVSALQLEQPQWSYADLEQLRIWPSAVNDSS